MTESQVKSREAKVDFNEDSFEGEEAKTKNNFKRWNIWHRALTIWMEFSVVFSGQMELHFFSTKETK